MGASPPFSAMRSMPADKLKRIYRRVEDGVVEVDDILRDRLERLKLGRERAQAALDRIQAQAAPATEVSTEMIERFGRRCAKTSPIAKFRSGKPISALSSIRLRSATMSHALSGIPRHSNKS